MSNPVFFRTSLGALDLAVSARLQVLEMDQVIFRLWAKDVRLWKDDPAHHASIKNRLGWLEIVDVFLKKVPELEAFAAEIKSAGFRHVLLLGMGGSSLCPEVLRLSFGVAPGFPDLRVLDSTDPAAVRAASAGIDLEKTLFLVASKSGGTIEVTSFYQHFAGLVRRPDAFVAITDPGSSLEKLAKERGFRRVFLNPVDIGGRYSALTYFGLVPAVLIGVNLDWFLRDAGWMVGACASGVSPKNNPAAVLGVVMAEAMRAGRDKLTLIQTQEIAALGSWIEQLVAESTGKEGLGILPVDDEPALPVEAYGPDRLFVAVRFDPARPDPELDARLAALEKAGHPVLQIALKDRNDLAGEFYRWELATAIAGAILRINPFDEPNVKESKDLTAEVLARFAKNGALPEDAPVASGDGVTLWADPKLRAEIAGKSPAEAVAAHLRRAGAGDFLAWLAYLPRTDALDAEFRAMRAAIAGRKRLATTLGYGPRFQHSTGQLHKGGPNTGVFFQVTADAAEDLPIPGAGYGFRVLERAQALGDFQALVRRDRRALRVHLGADIAGGLRKLRQWVEAAVS